MRSLRPPPPRCALADLLVSLLERLRQQTARSDALLALSLVGTMAGIITGAVTVAFRLAIETLQLALLVEPESYESLAWPLRVLLPTLGGLAVGLLFSLAATGSRQVGVTHVMDALVSRAGRLPLRNALLQFAGGLVSIASGHSVGREGPAVHLGAASSSLLGQWLRLPNNCIRTLVACGTAASIAASFNTPLAGVIFAMEVVMMEYSVIGFTPVILAAVAGTWTSHLVYGAAPAFDLPVLRLVTLWELPYVLFVGVVIGVVAGLFNHFIDRVDRLMQHIALWVRVPLAGLLTGLIAIAAPEVMGVGYDTVELALLGEMTLTTLVVIVVAKFVATGLAISLGVPAGLIGPTLVIGATLGGALGLLGHTLAPESSADAGLYAIVGMAAMMGAVLQAPLAALMAIVELTVNPHILLPGMIAVVAASLISRELFGADSVFITMLRARGVEYAHDPIAVSLNRTGVTAVMSRRFVHAQRHTGATAVRALLAGNPEWVIVSQGDTARAMLRADVVRSLLPKEEEPSTDVDENLDLLAEGLEKEPMLSVRLQATLSEALSLLDENNAATLAITSSTTLERGSVAGVLTRAAIEAGVRFGGVQGGIRRAS